MRFNACILVAAAVTLSAQSTAPREDLETGFRNPPRDARPDVYWLWLNGFVHPESARADLQAMKDAGLGGVLLFDMGAAGDKAVRPPAGPEFLSPPGWHSSRRLSHKRRR